MSGRREEAVEERVYNVPLGGMLIAPIKKRTPRAIRILRSFVIRHMKPDRVIISEKVNAALWKRGIEGAPRHVRIRVAKGRDNVVTVHLAEQE